MIKKLLKKIKCKIFFCVSSNCSYNDEGKSKIKISVDNNEIKESSEINK